MKTIPYGKQNITEDDIKAVNDVLKSDYLTQGPKVLDFEIAFSKYVGSKYEVINLGNDQTVTLNEMISTIENVAGRPATIDRQPEQPGDVPQTWADVSRAYELFGYKPKISFSEGVSAFYQWWISKNE